MGLTRKDTTDGARAEAIAAGYLEARGLVIVARNYRVRGGEIDLIARSGKVTVFVEVRLRRHPAFGSAADSITVAKRKRLIRTARHWLATHGVAQCRFDCVLLERLDATAVEWIPDAFTAD
ncbi:MAG: YraN family protein [Zoogloeaceae bacterium]|jgi:putative endonuclease|nr:YraN family protein [Zoogloeaceae bacterium]